MEKDLVVKDEKYELLVEQIRAIMSEAVHNSRWFLIEGYWNTGKLIREEFGKGELTKLLTGLSVDVNLSTRTLWRALAAYDKYPELGKIPEGKNITWNKLITKYLPEPQTETPPIPQVEGKYNVIYADPPWDVKAGPDWGSGEESKAYLKKYIELTRKDER